MFLSTDKLFVYVSKCRYVILVAIVLLGFLLRYQNFSAWPREGATFDEYAWVWQGMSLINTGVPTSWSPHKQYQNREYFQNSKGASFLLVTPYLEHPPLFGLTVGLYAKAQGINDFNSVTLEKIRPFALILGVAAIVGVYAVSSVTAGIYVGLLASLLYAIMPSVVVGSRLVQNENFFIVLFLFSLWGAICYVKNKSKVGLLLAIVLSSVLPLAKIPWIVAPAANWAVFMLHKKYKISLILFLATSFCFSLFLYYGFSFDGNLFISLWKLQLNRYDIGFDTLFALFRDPIITDRFFLDGFVYLGIVAFGVVAAVKNNKYTPILLGFLSYFMIYLYAIPNEPGHGWYRYPLYPFFVIMIALMIKETFNKNMLLTWITILIPGLAALATAWQSAFGFSIYVYRAFLVFSALGLLTLIFPNRLFCRYVKIVNILLLIFVLVLVMFSGMGYSEQ